VNTYAYNLTCTGSYLKKILLKGLHINKVNNQYIHVAVVSVKIGDLCAATVGFYRIGTMQIITLPVLLVFAFRCMQVYHLVFIHVNDIPS
jgi:hypothetical protein